MPAVIAVLSATQLERDMLQDDDEMRYRFAETADGIQAPEEVDVVYVAGARDGGLRDTWARMEKLRWVHVAAAGVDGVLFPELVGSTVLLTNSRGLFDAAMAEYTVGLILALAKGFAQTVRDQDRRVWNPRETETLDGATLVVIGVGVIARRIVSIARTLGMRVIGVGRTARSGDPDFGDIVSHTNVLEVLPLADWLLVVAPRTALTEGLIDSHALKHLKPSARVVNVGRSAILDQRALCTALARGRLAGAAVDVLDVEPAPPSDPVWTTPNLLVSPHMGGDLVGWRADAARLFLENLGRWRRGEPLQNVVDKALGYVAGA